MNPKVAVTANSVVGRVGSLESCSLSYGVHGSYRLREILNGNILGSALGALIGVFFHFLSNVAVHAPGSKA